jgi:hypothetical protein
MRLHSFKRYLSDYEINLQWGNYGPNWGPSRLSGTYPAHIEQDPIATHIIPVTFASAINSRVLSEA